MAHHGGKHAWDITPAQAHEAFYWFNAASIHYGITICIAKLAVLWLYRRVFSPQRQSSFDNSIVALTILLILFYTSTTLVKIFECSPRAKIFNPKLPGKCIDIPKLLNTSGMFNTVTDVIILLLPVKAVWNMNMRRQKKVIVVLVFTFGLWLRGQPNASIVNGDSHQEGTHRRWTSRGVSMLNLSKKHKNNEAYHELDAGHMYDVKATRGSGHHGQYVPGEVNVTQEVSVESRVV
ncbi:MAG: hypothetical protein Q9209_000347 [Squamulea sp. 1 TL-2023]